MTYTFLLPQEVQRLTERQRRAAQGKVLRAMGIEHKVRPDGSIAILRAHILRLFDGTADSPKKSNQAAPNWAAISLTR